MAVAAFTDGRVYVGAYDLSGQTNTVSLDLSATEIDASSIKDGWDVAVLGRKKATLDVQGMWAAGTGYPDNLYGLVGTANTVMTVAPDGDAGGVAYSMRGVVPKYSVGAPAGDLVRFTAGGVIDVSRAVRGTILVDDVTARTSTANSSALQLGAAGSTQTVYAAMHVVAVSGTNPTLDVVIASDDNSGFTSGTSRITLAQQTTTGAVWGTAAGAITDDWWRAQPTIGGTNPSFTVVVVVAIH